MAEMQAGKAAKQATIASLLVGLAGLPEPEPSEEPPQLPDRLDNVKGMQVGRNPIKSCQVINIFRLLLHGKAEAFRQQASLCGHLTQ